MIITIFVGIYRECTRKPYSFWTYDPRLPASDPLRFRKNLLSPIKMAVTDQRKIIDNLIKANQDQYDLGRSAAKNGDFRKI